MAAISGSKLNKVWQLSKRVSDLFCWLPQKGKESQ